ncbi:MAG: MurT ligase domain-containing protein [Candidatus Daviesbacteria bacterium]|nr:MurT ligase domain-containing protein [Candidatus Daviesbacteria bacterium]
MDIKFILSILLGKAILSATKLLNIGGGSAAPGYYALKFYPELVTKLSKQIPKTIVITGTNGKTTTAKMLGHFISSQGLKVLRNTTGSNLERGIASALISNFNMLTQSLNYDAAIWELDEAAFNSVALKLSPDIIVFLNVFRDQLDRYGEVDSIVAKWCKTAIKLKKSTKVFFNGDDASLIPLEKCFTGTKQTFGLSEFKIRGEKALSTKQQKLDFEAKNIEIKGLDGTKFEVETKTGKWGVSLSIPGIYHVYDFLASFAVSQELKLAPSSIINSFKTFSPAFGRVEKFKLLNSQSNAYIFLIKNPIGATQVFQTIKPQLKKDDRLLLILNDNFADGTDVSWIWDAGFEELRLKNLDLRITCSGTRAEELALRLKYAGFNPTSITIEDNIEKAFKASQTGLNGRLFILPTYTGLLSLQKILAHLGIKERYWKEN